MATFLSVVPKDYWALSAPLFFSFLFFSFLAGIRSSSVRLSQSICLFGHIIIMTSWSPRYSSRAWKRNVSIQELGTRIWKSGVQVATRTRVRDENSTDKLRGWAETSPNTVKWKDTKKERDREEKRLINVHFTVLAYSIGSVISHIDDDSAAQHPISILTLNRRPAPCPDGYQTPWRHRCYG